MQFKQYPSYKDSGVEWLGEVPEGWEVNRVKNNLANSLVYGANESAGSDDREYPRYIRITDISDDGNLKDDTFKSLSWEKAQDYLLSDGDILLARSGSVGRSYLYKKAIGPACHAGYLLRARFNRTRVNLGFVMYYFQSYPYWEYIKGINIQSTIPNVNAERYENMPFPYPSLDEQQKIVSFLDTETARIDNLIAKQEKLIELLEEQRKSIISHAVTKGLDPNAPMKDSGVEWLGEVPEHWKLTPIKHLVYTQKGFAFSSHIFKEDGVGITKASDIKNGSILKPSTFIDENHFDDYQKYQLYSNDIIISTVGSTPDVVNSAVGQIGLLPQDLQGCLLNQNTVIFRSISNKIEQKFLYYVLLSKGYRSYLDLYAHGTANQASLSIVDMLAFSIPLPFKKEQMGIVRHIEEKSSLILQLIEKQKELIENLKEYRSSIISHAVTGKIDVREYAE